MRLGDVAKLIDVAILSEPPGVVTTICNDCQAPYYTLLFLLAEQSEGLFVELGVEKGRGCGCLAAGNEEAHVIGIDHCRPSEVDVVQRMFPNFIFLEQSSLPVPDVIKQQRISILHIDTEHTFAQAREEFNAYEPFLADGAVVLFDDLHAMDDGVMGFFSTLPYPKIQDDRLHPMNGYGVLIYDARNESIDD